ncbi:hypothetical protein CYMTET_11580 [Cymbomonas tetramitiformis]|uniref:Uncharacterized protein n=1 Tax=Cymbomonas tetramitiformis TaxID=36881 RepID=A0AAE0GMA2_9CHLO|nr:hypothetical protein CYMTET_11580 [Cymbomonas tetramitiformis]
MFFNDPSVLSSTPVEEGRENEYLEQMSYAFTYSTDIVTILRTGGYNPKHGFTLDNETADTDFTALLSALRHVLFPVSFADFSKILDLGHDYDFYHVVLNEIVFTVLPVVLRGTALALYTEAARDHPGDGRYILQRLRYEVEGVPDSDTDRFWVKMRSTIIDENNDPAPQLTTIRDLGDKHARINNGYNEEKRVKDLYHILTASAKQSPFVTPLYVPIIRELRSGARPKKPSFNSASAHREPTHAIKPVGEWRPEPAGALIMRWKGVGYPCILCFRLWGLTDAHHDTKGICPFTCKEAYNVSRVPDSALPAGNRPLPREFAAALASFQGAGGATAQSVVLAEQQPDPPPDAAVMTFMAPPADPPPSLDHAPAADSGVHSVPADGPNAAGMPQHGGSLDFAFEPEPIAMLGFADGEEDWPAFRETPWIPPIIDSSTSRQKTLQ